MKPRIQCVQTPWIPDFIASGARASRQQPQDGPEGESCTNWHVTMYFDGSAGTYTIGAPPNGYKAAYQACSA